VRNCFRLRFRQLQQAGVLDLMTCAATHGYAALLPPDTLRRFRPSAHAIRGSIGALWLGERPLGILAAEWRRYYEGLDQQLAAAAWLCRARWPRACAMACPPRYGILCRYRFASRVAFFGR